jgi:iron complex transport system permease protein
VIFVTSLAVGSVPVSPWQAIAAITGNGQTGMAAEVVRNLRLPRALAGFACGALLSVAGALLQILLRNPLADPYILGVSGGAATFALLAMLLMWPVWGVDAAALAGAVCAVGMILVVARRAFAGSPGRFGGMSAGGGGVGGVVSGTAPTLLLAGVVLAAGWGALVTLLLSVASDTQLRGMVFWLTGDLNGASHPWPAVVSLVLVVGLAMVAAPRLNVLLRGDAVAHTLGIAVAPLRWRIVLLASVATAAAVTTAGTIGFVGLVVPHVLRLSFGNDQRMLLPASALAGGALTMAADLVARTIVAPVQLPVGALTAAMGVPLFIWMLIGGHGRGR